ncbi:MAG: tetratricopeptide repeat protein [Vampirovibrionales bacterium]|nr:tetratricopeptide repeat protein [Vampirovibrionales bacterium]
MSIAGWPTNPYASLQRLPLSAVTPPVYPLLPSQPAPAQVSLIPVSPPLTGAFLANALPATASVVNLKGFSASSNPANSPTRAQATKIKEWGNTLFKSNQLQAAAMAYQQAMLVDPYYSDPIFNLGKTFLMLQDHPNAIVAFSRVLGLDPKDNEARVLLAKSLEKSGRIQDAMMEYLNVLRQDRQYDPAHRRFQLLQARLRSPQDYGRRMMDVVGYQNLQNARQLVKAYLINASHVPKSKRQALVKLLEDIPVSFDTTQSLNGSTNMGEYIHLENNSRGIRLKSELAFAHPNVIGAYWVHELIHALDNDGLSSVQEEQECYLESTKFWQAYKSAVEEPNLDLALLLYQQQPEQPTELLQKISELYLNRNPTMPQTSPGHGMPAKGAQWTA